MTPDHIASRVMHWSKWTEDEHVLCIATDAGTDPAELAEAIEGDLLQSVRSMREAADTEYEGRTPSRHERTRCYLDELADQSNTAEGAIKELEGFLPILRAAAEQKEAA